MRYRGAGNGYKRGVGDEPPSRPGRAERIDAFQRRHGWVGLPLGVAYKAFDDRAPYLAALVTYYAFVSLFPLLLLFVTIMGFVLQGDPHLRQTVVNSSIDNVPVIGPDLGRSITGFKGSAGALVVGVVGVLYGGLGVTQAAQAAFNTIYSVPRNSQPNPLRSRLRSIALVLLLGTFTLVTSSVNLLVSTGNNLSSRLDIGVKIAGYAVVFVLNVGLFSAAFQVLTAIELGWRDVVKGGLIAAAGWEALQALGSRYVVHEVNHGTALYGIFGVVLAVIAWIYLVALVVMLSAEINVVLDRRLWPRALLTPFTDDIDPTTADLACYRSYARAQRYKGWQHIDVGFSPPARPGAGRAADDPGPR